MILFDNLKKIYTTQTYFEKYGGYIWLAIIIIMIFSSIVGMLISGGTTNSLKKNWVKHRCNPGVMPFAGIINNTTSKSALEYTEENFVYCVEDIITTMAEIFLTPILEAMSVLGDILNLLPGIFSELLKALEEILAFLRSLLGMLSTLIGNMIIGIVKLVRDVENILTKGSLIKYSITHIIGTIIATVSVFADFMLKKLKFFIFIILLIPIIIFWGISLGKGATAWAPPLGLLIPSSGLFQFGVELVSNPFTAPFGVVLISLAVVLFALGIVFFILFIFIITVLGWLFKYIFDTVFKASTSYL